MDRMASGCCYGDDADGDVNWMCSNENTGTSGIFVITRTEFPGKTRSGRTAARGWTSGSACSGRERCSGSAAWVCW